MGGASPSADLPSAKDARSNRGASGDARSRSVTPRRGGRGSRGRTSPSGEGVRRDDGRAGGDMPDTGRSTASLHVPMPSGLLTKDEQDGRPTCGASAGWPEMGSGSCGVIDKRQADSPARDPLPPHDQGGGRCSSNSLPIGQASWQLGNASRPVAGDTDSWAVEVACK